MDAEAFMSAQLWLHELPPNAWPAEGSKAVAAAAPSGGDLSKVILSDARCCFLLDAIWPTAYGRGSSRGGDLDGVATTRRHRQLHFLLSRKKARGPLSGRTGSFHEKFYGVKEGKKGGGGDGARGEAPRPESEVDFTGEFDFGLAVVQGTDSDGAGAASAAGEYLGEVCRGATKEAPASKTDDSRPRESGGGSGVLLLRIDGRVYQAEHTLIQRIAYPKGGSGIRGNGDDGGVRKGPQTDNPQHGKGVPSSTAFPREEESSAAARHVAGDPAPAGVGEAARTGKRESDAPTYASKADNACCRSGGGGDNSDCGARFMTGGRESSSTFAAAGGRDGGIAGTAVGGAKRKRKLGAWDERVGAKRSAEGRRGSRWDTGDGGGGGGGEDSGRRRPPRQHRGGSPPGEFRCARGDAQHQDVCSCCCDDVKGRAAAVEGRRDTGACCGGGGGGGGCDCSGVEVESPTMNSSIGEGGVFGAGDLSGETPYCGLLFPGLVLKFWLPRRRGWVDPDPSGAGARLEAVKRLQGVVTELMRGLSSSTRAHPLAMATGETGQVPDFNSPPRSASEERGRSPDGSRDRRAAWDEFVYGTHVLLSLQAHEQEQMRTEDPHEGHDMDRWSYCGTDHLQGHGELGDGCNGFSVGGGKCGEGEPKSSSAATKRATSKADGVGVRSAGNLPPCSLNRGASGRAGPGWEWKAGSYDGGLSDLGRRRALATLVECFSRARVPLTARSIVKQQLQAAEISAERALEDALDRAFPLDLSQARDSESRKSTVGELEACCARARAAREALLPLNLLPAPEMLREGSDW